MPRAKLTLADGTIDTFEVPEGTTPEQAQAMAQARRQLLEARVAGTTQAIQSGPATASAISKWIAEPSQRLLRDAGAGARTLGSKVGLPGAGGALGSLYEGAAGYVPDTPSSQLGAVASAVPVGRGVVAALKGAGLTGLATGAGAMVEGANLEDVGLTGGLLGGADLLGRTVMGAVVKGIKTKAAQAAVGKGGEIFRNLSDIVAEVWGKVPPIESVATPAADLMLRGARRAAGKALGEDGVRALLLGREGQSLASAQYREGLRGVFSAIPDDTPIPSTVVENLRSTLQPWGERLRRPGIEAAHGMGAPGSPQQGGAALPALGGPESGVSTVREIKKTLELARQALDEGGGLPKGVSPRSVRDMVEMLHDDVEDAIPGLVERRMVPQVTAEQFFTTRRNYARQIGLMDWATEGGWIKDGRFNPGGMAQALNEEGLKRLEQRFSPDHRRLGNPMNPQSITDPRWRHVASGNRLIGEIMDALHQGPNTGVGGGLPIRGEFTMGSSAGGSGFRVFPHIRLPSVPFGPANMPAGATLPPWLLGPGIQTGLGALNRPGE